MDEYIDRDEVFIAGDEAYLDYSVVQTATLNISAADVAPVVRCKDCKHWHKDTMFCGYMPYGEASERVNWYADDFCSYGERKDGDDE